MDKLKKKYWPEEKNGKVKEGKIEQNWDGVKIGDKCDKMG